MAKPKSIFALARHSSCKFSNNKNDALDSAHTELRTSEVAKRPAEELLKLLSNLPEESDSERELSFSFLINNESSKMHDENNDTKNDDTSKIEESQKVTNETKEKAKRRRNRRSQSITRDSRRTTCFTLAELENRDMNLIRGFGCFSALLVGRQHRAIHSNAV